jgi:hypothetical protein
MFPSQLFGWMSRAVRTQPGSPRRHSVRLSVEILEDRTVPAGGLTANQATVSQLYLTLLNRPVDSAGLAFWSGLLDQGKSATQVVVGLENSLEFRTNEVNSLYQCLLHRPADQAGLNSLLVLFNNNNGENNENENNENNNDEGGSTNTLNTAVVLLLSSQEFFQDQGGTNAGFVTGLYQTLLGRAPDQGGAQGFTQALTNGLSRAQVVQAFLSSQEYQTREVQTAYQLILHRTADTGGLQGFTSALSQGQSVDNLVAALAGSQEFVQNAQTSTATTPSTTLNVGAGIVCGSTM